MSRRLSSVCFAADVVSSLEEGVFTPWFAGSEVDSGCSAQ